METFLDIRRNIIVFIKNYENLVLFLLKFISGLVIFNLIMGGNLYNPMFARLNTGVFGIIYILILALGFALLPATLNYLIIILNVCISISLYPLVSAFVLIVLLSILVFYGRLAPKESIIALLTYFLLTIDAPYVIPLIAGLYCSITAFIPIIVGCFLYSFHLATTSTIELMVSENILEIDTISQFIFINKNIMSSTLDNSPYIVIGFVLAFAFFAVYFISRLTIDYNREIGVIVGSIFSLIGMIFVELAVDSSNSLILAIFMIFISCCIALISTFFEAILDYKSADKVFFQDDDNYYFVKIVPKIDI